ncbi:MAG TPA: S-methyl-5-thioribose-1-phosphate isomerase [Acidimicrobiia bacterium]|nr:S-methyl-5-thioribose-1-phosphate isomerase [Acidimicrobiia bacterium]
MREFEGAVTWEEDGLHLIDQTALPDEVRVLHVDTVAGLLDAISRLAVRGAPALGAVGALGVVVALDEAAREGWDARRLDEAIDAIRSARPTAVNLAWGVDQVAPLARQGRDVALDRALAIVDDDRRGNHAMGRLGADWLAARLGERPLRLLTHCNAGSLATTGWGTALGVVRELAARGLVDHVLVDETRPLLQGSRLTAWELAEAGIEHVVIPDGAAAGLILGRKVDAVVIGADRIAANGDTANKVGSAGLALASDAAGIPFVVAAPETTIDAATPTGDGIEIEERDEREVLSFAGRRVAPATSRGLNPAFDVTPARLVTVIVTDRRVIRVADGERPGDVQRGIGRDSG